MYDKNQKEYYLNIIPMGYLKGILKNTNLSNLKKFLERNLNQTVKNPINKVDDLTKNQITEIIIENDLLSDSKYFEYYMEYRDNKNPGFVFFKFDAKLIEKLDYSKNNFKAYMESYDFDNHGVLSNEKSDHEDKSRKYKHFNIKNIDKFKKGKFWEIKYEFLERYNYVDENYNQKYIFELKWGFFWLDFENNFLIVKFSKLMVAEKLKEIISLFFNSSSWKFQFQESIIKKILDDKDLFKKQMKAPLNNQDDYVRDISIVDPELYEKSKKPILQFLLKYERKLGKYKSVIPEMQGKYNISVYQNGTIRISGVVLKIEKIRKWLIELLVQFIRIQENLLKNAKIDDLLKSNNIVQTSELYKNVKNNSIRENIYNLIQKIYYLKENNSEKSVEFRFPIGFYYFYRNYLTPFIDFECSNDECNSPFICNNKVCDCSSFELGFENFRDPIVKCIQCKDQILEKNSIFCLEKHENEVDYSDSIGFILNNSIRIQINSIMKKLNLIYNIDPTQEIFYIYRNRLFREKISERILFNYDDLPAFDSIPKINEIPDDIKKAQVEYLEFIMEKCDNFEGKCRTCGLYKDTKKTCLLKTFARISDGRPHPHSGCEFGDFIFSQKFSHGNEEIVGIAKSSGKFLKNTGQNFMGYNLRKLTLTKNDRLLPQVYKMCNYGSISFVMVVSGKFLTDELKNALVDFASLKKTKIVIIGPKELVPIFAHYGITG